MLPMIVSDLQQIQYLTLQCYRLSSNLHVSFHQQKEIDLNIDRERF